MATNSVIFRRNLQKWNFGLEMTRFVQCSWKLNIITVLIKEITFKHTNKLSLESYFEYLESTK
jgi:hypothetical protein